jgi:uncharacterized protein (DUF924 family)
MRDDWTETTPEAVLGFWFPDDGHWRDFETHRAFWMFRMRGGADDTICTRFADLTEAVARGRLDPWAETPRGRLALIVALDQFPRSLWRGTPGAHAQDIRAARLGLEGLANGHWDALPNVWEKAFALIAIGHCEGPDHLERMAMLADRFAILVDEAPEHLRLSYRLAADQHRLHSEVIAAFGRYPHRNAVLGRLSTPAEEAWCAAGNFPHQRPAPATREGLEALLARRDPAVPDPALPDPAPH